MLNLDNPVKFTPQEQLFIDNNLVPLLGKGWNNGSKITKRIKAKISEHTIKEQGCRCAYCERLFSRGDVEIEHIACKELYGEFTFEPYNLVSSCGCCNAPINKGRKNTVCDPVDRNNYNNNQFVIVHPYFDNPEDHLKYIDDNHIIFDYNNCSDKGKATIDMFHWQELWAVKNREMASAFNNLPINILQYVAEVSAYK